MPQQWLDQAGLRPGNVEVLDVEECRTLLAARTVGRLAYVAAASKPKILPLNYTLVAEFLLLRTDPASDVARSIVGRPVAFEVDDLDEFLRAGWSVQVHGFTELLPLESIRMLDLAHTPEPWAEGDRSLVLRLPLSDLTGRRVHAA